MIKRCNTIQTKNQSVQVKLSHSKNIPIAHFRQSKRNNPFKIPVNEKVSKQPQIQETLFFATPKVYGIEICENNYSVKWN